MSTPLNQTPAHTPTEIAFFDYHSTTDLFTYSFTQNSQHPKRITIWHLGTVDHLNQHKSTATFPDMTAQITNNNGFRLPTNTINAISFFIKPPSPPDTTSFPNIFTNSFFNPIFFQFIFDLNIPPPNPHHLHYWCYHDFKQVLTQYFTANVCYTDGSDDPKNDKLSSSAATFNTSPPIFICNISPIKGS